MRNVVRWVSTTIIVLAWIVSAIYFLWWIPVPRTVSDSLCPVAFRGEDSPFFEMPGDGEVDQIPFDLFCILLGDSTRIKSLNREIYPSTDVVVIVLVAQVEGYERPVSAEKRIASPTFGAFDFSEQKPRFGDGGEIVLHVVKDDGLAAFASFLTGLAAVVVILVVRYLSRN